MVSSGGEVGFLPEQETRAIVLYAAGLSRSKIVQSEGLATLDIFSSTTWGHMAPSTLLGLDLHPMNLR